MPSHPYALLDVFTSRPLAGNQLAVFTSAQGIDEGLLQPLARELNLAETVFMFPAEQGGDARIRIFTTTTELPFAGHPTLGTACLVAADRLADGGAEAVTVRLEAPRGMVPVEVRRDEIGQLFGWMSQPLPTWRPWSSGGELCAILGVPRPTLPVEVYDNGIEHLFVILDDVEQVDAIVPDFAALGRHCGQQVRVNVAAGLGTSYTTRMFSPFDHVPEDPATGSAAGPLGVHLFRHGRMAAGQTLTISQGAQVGRPSTLHTRVVGTPEAIQEVLVGGGAQIVAAGQFTL